MPQITISYDDEDFFEPWLAKQVLIDALAEFILVRTGGFIDNEQVLQMKIAQYVDLRYKDQDEEFKHDKRKSVYRRVIIANTMEVRE